MKNKKLFYRTLVAILLIVGVVGVVLLAGSNRTITNKDINSFEECVSAGHPVLESYPPQCETLDGRLFTADVEQNEECVGDYSEKGQEVNLKTNMITTESGKKVRITDDTRILHKEGDEIIQEYSSLSEICHNPQDGVCGPYYFALSLEYCEDKDGYKATKVIYSPQ